MLDLKIDYFIIINLDFIENYLEQNRFLLVIGY